MIYRFSFRLHKEGNSFIRRLQRTDSHSAVTIPVYQTLAGLHGCYIFKCFRIRLLMNHLGLAQLNIISEEKMNMGILFPQAENLHIKMILMPVGCKYQNGFLFIPNWQLPCKIIKQQHLLFKLH